MPAVKREHGPSAVIVKVEQRDLVQVSPDRKKSRAKDGCRPPPKSRSRFTTPTTPPSGPERRKELSKEYEARRRRKRQRTEAAAATELPPKTVTDELQRKFKTSEEVLVDLTARVSQELSKLHSQGRVVLDYEEREDFLKILQHRLALLCFEEAV